jgi:Transposase IS66 family
MVLTTTRATLPSPLVKKGLLIAEARNRPYLIAGMFLLVGRTTSP